MLMPGVYFFFFFSSRRRHTRFDCDWSSDVCSSDLESTLGWVHAPLTGKTPHMVVTGRTANLRAGPGQNHRVVGKLAEMEVVRTLRKQGSWAQVQRDNGQKGWVARSLTRSEEHTSELQSQSNLV